MLACAIGKFDALHRGHQALTAAARALGEPAIMTFTGMAAELGWEPRLPIIAESDRQALLTAWGVREITLPFADIRGFDPAAFLHRVQALGVGAVVVGEDFRFGRDRSGSAAELPALAQAAGLHCHVVPAVCDASGIISSSRVRAALAAGDCSAVHQDLGRWHRLHGTVVHGEGRGRRLGVPTCNISHWQNQPPGPGVYAAWARLGDSDTAIPAAVNAGHLPTVSGGRPFTVEAHLIDWSGDAYDRSISIACVARLRGEQKFSDLTALQQQLTRDIHAASTMLKRVPSSATERYTDH